VKQRLRMIAAEEGTTSQALLEEALDLLFIKKGKQAIR
jgi:antitoxin-like ribbon-helix-helix protein